MRLFVQGEGINEIEVVEVEADVTVEEVIQKAHSLGLPFSETGQEIWVGFEDEVAALEHGTQLSNGDLDDRRIHCHRCHEVKVSVWYNNLKTEEGFSPATTVKRVFEWATGPDGFNFSPEDAAESILQVMGGSEQPASNVHIGSLVEFPNCELQFEIVHRDRPQG
ncbi:hypothetical protein [Alicyclobacillus sp. SO9]|uniref:hypothetical protein n=1 Tax=Alicyclobacillus sp. SO9 TaxID=2665646 RepID=UPI0018E7E7FA|nr:hypothetical protein [Alicyclobacillus sp. SO9]QQE77289.1 hypothetical protein GI364_15120 [Alicyclobacillus sp. SO9]